MPRKNHRQETDHTAWCLEATDRGRFRRADAVRESLRRQAADKRRQEVSARARRNQSA